jgi:hypothetical protein
MPAISILGQARPDSGVFLDIIGNQITAAASPSVGDELAWVLNDAGANEGLHGSFVVPDNYSSSTNPTIEIHAILDGAPGANDVLSFGFRKRVVADNGAADGTLDAEQTVSVTIGSAGQGYADEDVIVLSITLTGSEYAASRDVSYYVYVHATNTTYTGNVLVRDVLFRYTAA